MPAASVLPAEPLLRRVRARGGVRAYVGRDYALERAYSRAQAVGHLTCRAADVLAVEVLGVHPVLVWGDAWLVEGDVPGERRPRRPARRRREPRPAWRKVAERQATVTPRKTPRRAS